MKTNQPLTNSLLSNSALPYGKIYLVKGGADKLWWLLKGTAGVESLFKVKTSQLLQLLHNPHELEEPKTYIVFYTSRLDVKRLVMPSPTVRLFIWFPSPDGELSPNLSSIYKASYPTFISKLSLNQYKTSTCPAFSPVLDELKSLDKETYQLLISSFDDYPFALSRFLQFTSLDEIPATLYDSQSHLYDMLVAICNRDYSGFITHLNSVLSLSSSMFYQMFILSTDNFPTNTFGRLLTFATNKYGLYCPTLWFFYEQLLLFIKDLSYPSQLLAVKEFFMWVFFSSTCFATPSHRGLTKYHYRKAGKINMEFMPSLKAQQQFDEIINC